MAYQTTRQIVSLAGGGSRIGERQSVTPAAFTATRWNRLIEDGAIVEIVPSVQPLDLQFDNLTTIRGIGEERQNELTALGIRTFEQLADADIDGLVRDMEVSRRTISGWQRIAKEASNADS